MRIRRQKEKGKRKGWADEGLGARRHSFALRLFPFAFTRRERGFTLIELVITLTILTILTLGVIPLIKVTFKRQREQELREALREMRTAIEEFHRDTVGMQCGGQTATQQNVPNGPPNQPGAQQQQQLSTFIDPRSKVVISDCTIFGVDNPDRYPPDLETLVSGVNVMARARSQPLGGAGLSGSDETATEMGGASTKKKVYLRAIPVDPMTGRADWCLRSSYADPDSSTCSGGENVFDVRSKSDQTALNGKDKYSEW